MTAPGSAVTARFEVVFELGLHAHPSTVFGDYASRFDCTVAVTRADPDGSADGKSVLQLMMLAAEAGTVLTVHANGTDASAFVDGLEQAINDACRDPVLRRAE
jgi:phosphotransferase system HPr (HPr) family protein